MRINPSSIDAHLRSLSPEQLNRRFESSPSLHTQNRSTDDLNSAFPTMIDSTRGYQTRSRTVVPSTQPDNNPSSAAPATPTAQRLMELQIQNQMEELEHQ